jgi:hypothetical protein
MIILTETGSGQAYGKHKKEIVFSQKRKRHGTDPLRADVEALDTQKDELEALIEQATLSNAKHTVAAEKMTIQISHLEKMVSHLCLFFMLLAGRPVSRSSISKKRVICAVPCSLR